MSAGDPEALADTAGAERHHVRDAKAFAHR
jgi:hypothetical protein